MKTTTTTLRTDQVPETARTLLASLRQAKEAATVLEADLFRHKCHGDDFCPLCDLGVMAAEQGRLLAEFVGHLEAEM